MENNNGWITDRLPTPDDAAGIRKVLVWERFKGKEYVALCDYDRVYVGQPWQPIIQPPPYVKPRWKPKDREKYWCIMTHIIGAYSWDNDTTDKKLYNLGNCFQTREEAQEVFEKIKQLLKDHHDGR